MGMSVFRVVRILALVLAVLLLLSSPAFAAPGDKLGDILTKFNNSWKNFPQILSTISYLLGLFFGVWSMFKFKEHVDAPNQVPLSAGVKRFAAGGFLLALPWSTNVVMNSYGLSSAGATLHTTAHAAPTGGGMDQMIYDLITNAATPAAWLLSSFVYISALTLLIVGVTRLIKTAQEGPRGPGGLGTIMTFAVSGAMFAFGDMIHIFSNSLFGDGSSDSLMYTFVNIDPAIVNATDAAKIAPVIEALMTFITIVGVIAFVRGLFVLKGFADGAQGVSLAQALTFLIGGTLAINLGPLVNVLGTTVDVSGLTFS